MPLLSFAGASNFTISGGNFSAVWGDITTVNLLNESEGLTPHDLITPPAVSTNHTGRRLSRPDRKLLAERDRTTSPLPSFDIQVCSVPSSIETNSLSPLASSRPWRSMSSLRPRSNPSSSSEPNTYSTGCSCSVGHSTLPADIKEHHNLCSLGISAPNHAAHVDVPNPLIDLPDPQLFGTTSISRVLAMSDENPAPLYAPAENHSLANESSTPVGFQHQRTFLESSPSYPLAYPVSIVPLSRASPPPTLEQNEHSDLPIPPPPLMFSPLGDPPTPMHTLTPFSHTMPLEHTTLTGVPGFVAPPDYKDSVPLASARQTEPEDPSIRFTRLQTQRFSTKEYASGFTFYSQGVTATPSTVGTTLTPPTATATLPASLPDLPINDPHPLPTVSQDADPQITRWAPNSILDLAGQGEGTRFCRELEPKPGTGEMRLESLG